MLVNLFLTASLLGNITPSLDNTLPTNLAKTRCTQASWYGPGFHNNPTASGERFNQYALTAAHKYLPFGTRIRVTNRLTGRSVIVKINDNGPHYGNRGLDLSKEAASRIGMIHSGVAPVCYKVV